ncbi:flippase-like domain-containing protein [Mesobaculum littorinae]|uniref:Flippase-like domain-containing protein n=1 Tax=Mesobaculum littorinae TaxID=2486419 RepID=A0A438AIS6_9RHOB|nr:lysylphosphatidylglycerol synthase transmembrane domain-containing protein [Mesobaculum littorinae]RVV98525.1 flippase-like domain-containing protein [Mesobaculum littorinae]
MTRPVLSAADCVPASRAVFRRRRDVWVLAGTAVLLVIGLAGLARATGWQEIGAQLARLGPAEIAVLLGLSLINYLARGVRWHVLLGGAGLRLPLPISVLHFIAGLAMAVTPGRVGELVRLRWTATATGAPLDRAAPLALADRAGDLAAMALLLAACLGPAAGLAGGVAGGAPLAAGTATVAGALALAGLATRPEVLMALAAAGYRLTGRGARIFARGRRAARSAARLWRPRVLVPVLALGLVGWLAEAVGFHLLLHWLGAEIGLWQAAGIFVFATLAGGLTGAPGGIGGAEAAMIALLAAAGVPLDTALPATAIARIATLWFAVAIGVALFPLAEAHSRDGRHALV